MEYKETNPTLIREGVWNEKTCVRRTAGFDIDKTNLPADMKYLPKGAVLALDANGLKAVLVKTAKVYETAVSAATSIKIVKGSALIVNDAIGDNKITDIDKSNADYDVLTVAELSENIAIGTVLADENASKAIGLNYATVKLDSHPSCTPTIQAYEIEEDTLPYPVNEIIKTALTCRHDWKI